jgi:very-short-patch-repair endonuclease
VRALPRGPGSRRPAAVLALVDPDSGSVLESLCRVLLAGAGLAPEDTQRVIRTRTGVWIGRVDFAWPSARLVVEVDGFAFHSDRAAYRRDRRRGNALQRAGWLVLRFSWEDVVTHPEDVVDAVRAVLGEPCARCAA